MNGTATRRDVGVASAPVPPAGWQASQGTLARELAVAGRGLHTGKRVNLRIVPAQQGGIVFHRLQRGAAPAVVPVDPALRRAQPLCTMLTRADGISVRTVEHLLAALLAAEIDHACVELDAEEVPILDGSALPWVDALRGCGRIALAAPKRFIRVLEPVLVSDGDGNDRREMRIEPAPHYALSVTNELQGFGEMHWQGVLTPASFAAEVAPSRSYGRLKWAVPAIAAGYVRGMPILRGARPSCTATIVGARVLGGMRLPDEFVRHRVLDLVGDLALAGAPLLASVTAFRPSHEMNFRLVDALLSRPAAWEWV